MNAPTRPILRWHGGKWKLAPFVIRHFPRHRIYTETFGGAASILMRKAPAYAEIYNDLDGDVVNLFRLLRSEEAPRLLEQLELTPFSRAEFEASYTPAETSLERARKLVVRSFMGFGSDAPNIELRTGFRAQSPLSGRSPEKDWRNYPDALRLIIDRLRNVVVECRPAIEVMRRNDAPDTLHYVDPPYMPETRSIKSGRGRLKYHAYAHELDVGGHTELLQALRDLAGMVVLSGYPSPLYERVLSDWRRVEVAALADGARPRTEVLWLNPYCSSALDRDRGAGTLFADMGEQTA
jgi:DNA adenine methylase